MHPSSYIKCFSFFLKGSEFTGFLTSRKLNIFFQLVDIFLAINFFSVLFIGWQFYKPDLIVFLVILDHLI